MEKQLQAAVGYLELGMIEDAANEIECIRPDQKNSSEVLEVRMEIYRASEKWTLMEVVARELWKRHQDEPVYWNHFAWAVRRAESIESANDILMDAVKKFPRDALTRFNLGCYACQMGELKLAKERVRQAIDFDPKFKLLALDDADLEPLWESFKV
jgi:Tfp pilus assembly protein PilF